MHPRHLLWIVLDVCRDVVVLLLFVDDIGSSSLDGDIDEGE